MISLWKKFRISLNRKYPDMFVYLDSFEIHPHDRFLHHLVLRFFPSWLTPNMITAFRLCCVPVVFLLIASSDYRVGGIFFLLLASTDAIDGSLARTTKRVTRFGMLFDPFADKMLIGSLVFLLVFRHVNYWLAFATLAVEFVFIISALFIRYNFKTVKMANIWGKIKMLLQVMAVFLTLAALTFNFPYLFTAAAWLFGVALGFAILSFFTHGL